MAREVGVVKVERETVKTTSPGPIGMSRKDLKFFRIFVELFVFVIDSLVLNTAGS